jgi:hypothetical protein
MERSLHEVSNQEIVKNLIFDRCHQASPGNFESNPSASLEIWPDEVGVADEARQQQTISSNAKRQPHED